MNSKEREIERAKALIRIEDKLDSLLKHVGIEQAIDEQGESGERAE